MFPIRILCFPKLMPERMRLNGSEMEPADDDWIDLAMIVVQIVDRRETGLGLLESLK